MSTHLDTSYSLSAEFYDFISDYRVRPDVSFFVESATRSEGAVLELGCGTGRVLIPTARSGKKVVGLDGSRSMLQVCQQKLQREPVDVQANVELVHGDLRTFELSRQFGCILIPFRPFQHLNEVEEQLACLGAIHRHLVDDGRLVFDVFNPSLTSLTRDNIGVEESHSEDFSLPDGSRVVLTEKTVARDLIKQILSIEFAFHVTGTDGHTRRLVQPFQMRYFFRYELEHLLHRAGFVIESLFGDYERHPFDHDHDRDFVIVAKKA